ncbi:MAG: hypothetical protein MUE41_12750 [Gemmatimonadaceae bacterium]|jgi:hypothetical protein|nr:hypothetical protein [Gemmatimonadaceae bacterium]
MILLGTLSFWLALLMACWTTLVSTVGVQTRRADLVDSGARAMALAAVFLVLALLGTATAAWRSDPVVAVATTLAWMEPPVVRVVRTIAYAREMWMLLLATLVALTAWLATRDDARIVRRRAAATRATAGALLVLFLGAGAWQWSPYLSTPASIVVDPTLDAPSLDAAFVLHRWGVALGVALVSVYLARVVAVRWQQAPFVGARASAARAWIASMMALACGWWWRYPQDGMVLLASREWSLRVAVVAWSIATVALVVTSSGTRRRVGVVSLVRWMGGLCLLIGVVGQVLVKESVVELPPTTPRTVRDAMGKSWRFTNQGASFFARDNYQVLALAIDLTRGGTRLGLVTTEQRRYTSMGDGAEPPDRVVRGLRRGLLQDLFVAVSGSNGPGVAIVTARFVPGTSLLFAGAALLVLGVAPLAGVVRES